MTSKQSDTLPFIFTNKAEMVHSDEDAVVTPDEFNTLEVFLQRHVSLLMTSSSDAVFPGVFVREVVSSLEVEHGCV